MFPTKFYPLYSFMNEMGSGHQGTYTIIKLLISSIKLSFRHEVLNSRESTWMRYCYYTYGWNQFQTFLSASVIYALYSALITDCSQQRSIHASFFYLLNSSRLTSRVTRGAVCVNRSEWRMNTPILASDALLWTRRVTTCVHYRQTDRGQ